MINLFFSSNCKSYLQIHYWVPLKTDMFPKTENMKTVISFLGFLPKTFNDQAKGEENTFAESEFDS